jgi:hypothetical protein
VSSSFAIHFKNVFVSRMSIEAVWVLPIIGLDGMSKGMMTNTLGNEPIDRVTRGPICVTASKLVFRPTVAPRQTATITMAESLSPQCTPLKQEYDSCFNSWFTGYLEPAISASASKKEQTEYSKRKVEEYQEKCGKVWNSYKECVEVRSALKLSAL